MATSVFMTIMATFIAQLPYISEVAKSTLLTVDIIIAASAEVVGIKTSWNIILRTTEMSVIQSKVARAALGQLVVSSIVKMISLLLVNIGRTNGQEDIFSTGLHIFLAEITIDVFITATFDALTLKFLFRHLQEIGGDTQQFRRAVRRYMFLVIISITTWCIIPYICFQDNFLVLYGGTCCLLAASQVGWLVLQHNSLFLIVDLVLNKVPKEGFTQRLQDPQFATKIETRKTADLLSTHTETPVIKEIFLDQEQ